MITLERLLIQPLRNVLQKEETVLTVKDINCVFGIMDVQLFVYDLSKVNQYFLYLDVRNTNSSW